MQERIEGLRLFLKFIGKYKNNMEFSNFVYCEGGYWTHQKLVDLVQDLWQYGILKGNIPMIISSVCVNLMYSFGGDVDLIKILKWDNLKVLHKDGDKVSYVFKDIAGYMGIEHEISETLYKNLIIFKNLFAFMNHQNPMKVISGHLDYSQILCKVSITNLFEIMRGKFEKNWKISIKERDFMSMNFLLENPDAKLPCLNFDPTIKPNGDFNLISGVHREPVDAFLPFSSIRKCFNNIDATVASFEDAKVD
jgi:hypothetical protein